MNKMFTVKKRNVLLGLLTAVFAGCIVGLVVNRAPCTTSAETQTKSSIAAPAEGKNIKSVAVTLDNAIEAVERNADENRRCIGMSVKESKGMISAHFENYYAGKLDFDDGLPLTTKSDKRYHGFGMKSIKMLAEKYGGYVSVKAEDGVFNLNILLPISSKRGTKNGS